MTHMMSRNLLLVHCIHAEVGVVEIKKIYFLFIRWEEPIIDPLVDSRAEEGVRCPRLSSVGS